MQLKMSRRGFLKSAAASTVYSILPASVLGANEKINLACIGVGARGGSLARSIHATGMTNITALCDVAMGSKHTSDLEGRFPDVPKFKDFRRMFDNMFDKIDAVSVGTPDHSHFPICIRAMAEGKHVYVEKPLAHTFREVELLIEAEKRYGVVCQMGNQGHSGSNYFQFKSWVEEGIIKDVTHVDAYMNRGRPWYSWGDLDSFKAQPVPEHLDWDGWLAAVPYRPYSRKLHPYNWRGWFEFGNGVFGDWGPHIIDTIHQFLNLGLPESIEAVKRIRPKEHIFPMGSTVKFNFPSRGKGLCPMSITWYDGKGNRPPRPKVLEERRKIEPCGKIIYSKDLIFKGGTHSDTLRIIPEEKMREMSRKVPRITTKHSNHYENFVLACKGHEKTRSPFSVAGPLTQVLLLGVLAQRLGRKLIFDRDTKQITNDKTANRLLAGPQPRKGWEEFYNLPIEASISTLK